MSAKKRHLTVATSCCASFDAKGRTLAGLSDARDNLPPYIGSQRLTHSDCCGGLALSQWRGSDARHYNCDMHQLTLSFVADVTPCLFWWPSEGSIHDFICLAVLR